MKLGEYQCTKDFDLEETMNSVEVNHFKMDPHANYREANTYLKLMRSGKIKKMEDLNLKEVFIGLIYQAINFNTTYFFVFYCLRLFLFSNHL